MKKIRLILATIIIFFLLFVSFFINNKTKYSHSTFALDTSILITINTNFNKNKVNKIFDNVNQLIYNYENLFSKTIKNSDIYNINNNLSYIVSRDTAFLLCLSKYVYENINNKFDITLSDCIDLWKEASENLVLPTKEEINKALKTSNHFDFIIKNESDNTPYDFNDIISHIYDKDYINYLYEIDENEKYIIEFPNESTKFDLGAIAKGFIADKIKYYLINEGIDSGIINLGGNILCIGKNNNKNFNIGILKPFHEDSLTDNIYLDNVYVDDLSVVTSGIYQRYFKIDNDDTIYHHLIDNETGHPAKNNLYSQTIVSDNSIIADILSTICMLNNNDLNYKIINSINQNYNKSINLITIYDDYKIERLY